MNTKKDEREAERENVELLLPWHAAGTLSRRDALRVEEALANDNELARRYELVREELGEAIRLNESLGAPSARAMETLFAKIDAEPRRTPRGSFALGAALTGFFAALSPRALAYGAAAAALAIVLQAGLLAGLLLKEAAGPQLASIGSTAPVETGAHVFIRFNPQVTATDIAKFLDEHKARIVDGPAPGTGLFRLRIGDAAMSAAAVNAAVKRMAQEREVVGFAVPAAKP